MSTKGNSLLEALKSVFAGAVIIIALVIAWLIYSKVMGNPVNFVGGNPKGEVLPGNYLGVIYKGGMIVPLLISLILILITFCIERFISISRAHGKGNLAKFVRKVQALLAEDKIEDALEACDKHKSSLANVLRAGLVRYRDVQKDQTMAKDQKILVIQKEIEEATALELPMLSKNMVFLSTIASISVLIGLIGTVLGMIRAFAALAQAGAPDALALATGISEALINTAFGITGSTIAIIMFNYFSTKIDSFTFKIDEAGFSLVQTFATSIKS